MRKILVLFSVLVMCTAANKSAQFFAPTLGRTIVFTGVVDERAEQLGGTLLTVALFDPNHKAPIDILIDSYGGNVEYGNDLIRGIDALKQAGFTVRCVNVGHAYSMGFMIMMHCSQRYAIPQAKWMFHYPSLTMANVKYQPGFNQLSVLYKLEKTFVADLQHYLGKTEANIRFYCEKEQMWTTETLNDYSHGYATEVVIPLIRSVDPN